VFVWTCVCFHSLTQVVCVCDSARVYVRVCTGLHLAYNAFYNMRTVPAA